MSGRFTGVEALVAGRPSGSVLSEPDAQAITTLLGIGVPRMVVVGDVNALPAFPGDTVVVKAVGPAHKARVGGVAVVANRPAAILDAAARVGTVPGAHGVVVAERVEHDPDDELIAGVRWTDAFGPVVSIGRGGSAVERGPSPAILTAALADRSEQILHSHATGALPGLGDLAAALLDLGLATMPRLLTEFEMNPIVMTPDGPVALDALAVTGTGAEPGGRLPPADDAVARLLHPASIAIVGVSDTVNPGRQILRNVIAAGFPTEAITVVKAGFEAIDGCRCVASLDSLDGPVDLLVVAIAAGGVPALVTEVLTTAAARSVVLIPGGLGERPGTAAAAERIRVAVTTARSEGRFAPALLGPNSMGVRSVPGSYDTTFIPPERMTSGERRRAGVAVVAQSGAFTLSRLDRLPWLEPDYVVSVGNQIDLTVGDHLDHFAGDPTIDIVACYVEGFAPADGDRILRAATRLTARGGTCCGTGAAGPSPEPGRRPHTPRRSPPTTSWRRRSPGPPGSSPPRRSRTGRACSVWRSPCGAVRWARGPPSSPTPGSSASPPPMPSADSSPRRSRPAPSSGCARSSPGTDWRASPRSPTRSI